MELTEEQKNKMKTLLTEMKTELDNAKLDNLKIQEKKSKFLTA